MSSSSFPPRFPRGVLVAQGNERFQSESCLYERASTAHSLRQRAPHLVRLVVRAREAKPFLFPPVTVSKGRTDATLATWMTGLKRRFVVSHRCFFASIVLAQTRRRKPLMTMNQHDVNELICEDLSHSNDCVVSLTVGGCDRNSAPHSCPISSPFLLG